MSKSSSRGRSLSPAQAVSMMLVFVLLCGMGGLISAGFAMPLVGAASAVTNASQELFDELPEDFNILEPSQVSVIKASDGTEIAQFYAENRIVVALADISPNMQNAIVAVEDQRFYQHKGVDPAGIFRAFLSNASSGETQGASTLTQQYVRNVLIESALQSQDREAMIKATEKSPARKLREIKYALALEKKYSKQQILEGYLNIAAFGPSTYGVEASAEHYFSHSAKDLTIPEAALLAGLTNAPGAYDPVAFPEKAKDRMDWVLQKMYEEQFITKEDYDAGLQTQIADILSVSDAAGGCASAGSAAYFCEYVVSEIENSEIYGATQAERHQLLLRGGLTITTTLDPSKQQAADAAIQDWIPTGDPTGVKSALASVEPGTGRILSMAQNTNYGDASAEDPTATQISFSADVNHGGIANNGSSGFQPGSAFKPLILAQWYQMGRSGYESMDTSPTTFPRTAWNISCAPEYADTWQVGNANASESGTHNVVQNTQQSINVGYARMLSKMDVCSVTSLAASMGLTKADGSALDPRPTIVLGAQEATPLAMANAYATFSSHGVYCKPIAIDSIQDRDGNDLSVPSADCTQVMDAAAADKTTKTLSMVLSQSGTGANAVLANGRPGAGKTGTTEQMDNAWFVGYTPQLSAAVWIGHSDGYYSMQGQTIGGRYYPTMYGSDAAAPLWKEYMDAALADTGATPFTDVSLGAPGGDSDPRKPEGPANSNGSEGRDARG